MVNKKGLFKSKGTGILRKPKNMSELLNETSGSTDYSNPDKPLKPDAQMHNIEPMQGLPDIRLHVFIHGYLDDKLLDEVTRRKKDKSIPNNQANKRAVVEAALEKFL